MKKLDNLQQISEALEELGYQVKFSTEAIHIAIGGTTNPFLAVATVNDRNELVITCKVAKLGDLEEEKIPEIEFLLLDANTQIRPYAFGIISSNDNPDMIDAAEFPIILTDSLPLGDLCKEELSCSLDGLLMALESSSEIFRDGLK